MTSNMNPKISLEREDDDGRVTKIEGWAAGIVVVCVLALAARGLLAVIFDVWVILQ